MKLLITGGSGQLGTEIIKQLMCGKCCLGLLPGELAGAEILSPSRSELDICNRSAVTKYISDNKPDAVIHCAAVTNVDGCEDMPDLCNEVNGASVAYIGSACENIGAKLVYLSTDYVFSGDNQEPYKTDDECDPASAYGKSKRLGEINALKYCSRSFIVRASWIYGLKGKNFVKTIIRKASSAAEINVVDDQRGSPTNAEDLAFHILKLVVTEKYGIYQCTGTGICSWYEFAKEIVAQRGLDCIVLPCSSSQYPQKAKRPLYSAMDNSSIDNAVGNEMRCWKDALKDYIQRLEELN